MTDTEVIAIQARKIVELQRESTELTEKIKTALLLMGGIGGPLNDNKLSFLPAQLNFFWELQDILKD